MTFLKKFNLIALKIAGWSVVLGMLIIAVVIPNEVIGRYWLGRMHMWSNELTQYALVWVSMLGGAIGLKHGYHVGITSLTDWLSPNAAKAVKATALGAVLVFCVTASYIATGQVIMNSTQTSSTLGIPMSIPYLSMPIGFFLMVTVTCELLVDLLTGQDAASEPEIQLEQGGA